MYIYIFVKLFLNGPIKHEWISNICIWLIDGILTGSTNPGQSGPGSNGNEEVLHTP